MPLLASGDAAAVEVPAQAPISMVRGWARWLSPSLFTVLFWAGLASSLLISMWPQVLTSLVSQDDAMRLVELRAFLHGRSWFDLTEPRLGFAPGYLAHWSRLIDAPLAGLTLVFSAIGGPAFGEAAGRALWPLLLLLPLLLSTTALAQDLGGRVAALRAPVLALMGVDALILFRPGSIHHHNAQMVLAAVFVALTLRAPRSRRIAISAGLIGALALAVGLESLAILGIAALGYAMRFVVDPKECRFFGSFAVSWALASAVLLVSTLPPSLWSTTQCDAFAANLLVGIVVAGAGAGLCSRLAENRSAKARLIGLAVTGGLSLAAYGLADPSCLRGPFGHMDPQIWPLWLSHVAEMRSVVQLMLDEPVRAMLTIAATAAGLVALPFLWRGNRTPQALILGLVLIASSAIGAVHVRGFLYANWFAIPVLAAVSCRVRLQPTPASGPRVRPLTFVLAGLLILAAGLALFPGWPGDPRARLVATKTDDGVCARIADYSKLAALPPGLVLSHVNLGSYVLATTEHRVLVAPYHRLQAELIFARRLGAASPETAENALRHAGVDYLVECRGEADSVEDAPSSLRSALMAGQIPSFLERIGDDTTSPVLVWRMRR
jgi:hypothetical protein